MGQEFVIKSTSLEDKINKLLPSQGGFEPGVDLSASTQIIPVVDLTEAAEGSPLRQDLQSALSHDTVTSFEVNGTTSTLINTTGYWRIFGLYTRFFYSTAVVSHFMLNDGTTDKIIWGSDSNAVASLNNGQGIPFDFIIALEAGDSLQCKATSGTDSFLGAFRQLAALDGTLVNPV